MNARTIFMAALDIDDPTARDAYLEESCRANPNLRQRVDALMHSHEQSADFLNSPPPGIETTAIDTVAECAGDTIGPYKLLQQIGEGGFGVVYMAEQTEPVRRKVALKIIKPGMDTREVIARFEAERQALALMDHPNIAKVLDAGTTGEPEGVSPRRTLDPGPSTLDQAARPYFVMELVQGVAITEFCDQQVLDTRQRLKLFVEVCRAVQHAHQKGVIHRDLKPTNILVTLRDDRPVPKVIDFGVAKALSQRLTEKTLFTALGQVIGTPLYMSPEQTQLSELDVDTRSDVYSLGVLLYELLTGTTPFDAEALKQAGFDEMRRMIREDEPPRPSARVSTLKGELLSTVAGRRKVDPRRLGRRLSGELDWIVMKALEKDRGRRYESASALGADVQRYLDDEPVQAGPPSVVYRFRKLARRHRTALSIYACLFLVVIFAVGSVGWIVRDRTAQRAALETEVNQVLSDSDNWLDQQHWPRALAAAENAKSLLASGNVGQELRSQVQERISVLELVVRVEQIRTESMSEVVGVEFDYPGADGEFAEAFRAFGFDPVSDPPRQLSQYPAIRIELATALDLWALVRRKAAGDDDSSWRQLLDAARVNDPDRWRNELRTAWMQRDQEALTQLADSASVDELTLPTIHLLCFTLPADTWQHAIVALLHDAVRRYPNDFWINWSLGEFQYRIGEHSDSVLFYTAARALRPENLGVRINLGVIFAETGRIDEAIDEFVAAIRLHPADVLARFNLGRAYIQQGRHADAIDVFQESIRQDPDHSPAYAELVWLLATCPDEAFRNPALAVQYGKQAIQHQPQVADNWCNLGVAEYRAGHWQAALEALEKARQQINGFDENHQFFLAMVYWQLGNQEQALDAFDAASAWMFPPQDLSQQEELLRVRDEAEALIPEAASHRKIFERARDQLALAVSQPGRESFMEAESAAREAVNLNPNVGVSHDRLGRVLREYGRYLESADAADAQSRFLDAAAEFQEAVRLKPGFFGTFHALGDTLFYNLGRLDEAEAAFRQSLQLNPDQPWVNCALGDLFSRREQWTEAETHYHAAIQLDPTIAQFHRSLATSLQDQGRIVEAVAEISAASQVEPDAYDYYWIARLLSITVDPQDRDPQRALEAADRAVQLKPDDSGAWTVLGWARYRAEDWPGSIQALEKSCELENGGNEWQWFFLAMAYWQNDNEEQARSWYDRAARYVERVKPDAQEPYQFRDEAESLMPFARRRRESFARAQALHSQARSLVDEEKFADAEEALWEATRLDPDNWIYQQFLGDVLQQAGKLSEAEAAYQEAVRLGPDHPENHRRLADVLRLQGKHVEAARACVDLINHSAGNGIWDSPRKRVCRELAGWSEVFRQVVELRPEDPTLWIGLGQYHVLRSRWTAAATDYARAFPTPRADDETIFEYGGALLLSGDMEGYQRLCSELAARYLEPDDSWGAFVLARTCSIGPNDIPPQRLIEWAEKRLKHDTAAWVWHVLGLAHFRAGQFDMAIEKLEESIAGDWHDPGKAMSALVLAMSHHELGNDNQAVQWLQRGQEAIEMLRPENDDDPVGAPVPDWIELQLLIREAETLLATSGESQLTTDN